MALLRGLWARRRERPALVALSVLTVASVLMWPVVDAFLRHSDIIHATPFRYFDFGAYTNAIEAWEAGEPLYVENEDGGYHGSYLYPPVILLVFYPFVKLGWETGPILFGAFSLVLLWIGLEVVAEELGYRLTLPERLILLFGLFGFQPALFDFKMGQVGTLLAALFCFAFYAHERGERRGSTQYLSGILTTLGSAVKIYCAAGGAHLLRNRRRFVAAITTAGLLVLASFVIFGVETHQGYLDVLLWGKGWGTDTHFPHTAKPAFYRPMHFLGRFAIVPTIANRPRKCIGR